MNKKHTAFKILGYLTAVYLVLFFALVIPLHHHGDFDSHDDCAICAVSNQPFVSNITAIVHLLFVLFIILSLSEPQVQSFLKENLHLRSPPFAC
jgi:hypothetical protein